MPYVTVSTKLSGVLVLEPKVFTDARGFFFESFNAREFARATGVDALFVQDNHSQSAQGVLRGLHYQITQTQGKLVRVITGEIFDVAVDLRRASATFGQWTGVHLSAQNKRQLWIAPGFAHGFLTLSEQAQVLYKTTDYWAVEHERALLWNDPALAIAWPLAALGVCRQPVLSAKDALAPSLALALAQGHVFA